MIFEIIRTGDPYNDDGWDIREYNESFDETVVIFRGDLSPIQGLDNAINRLKKLYPGCTIKIGE